MGTIRLRDRDLADLLDASARCGEGCGRGRVEAVLDAIAALVDCDVAFWSWFQLSPDLDDHASASRTSVPVPAPLGPWLEHLDEYPVMSGRHAPVTMISDTRERRALVEPWLYQEALQPGRVVSELGMLITHGHHETNVVVLSRGSRAPFDDRDRLLLMLIRPHVDAALRRATHPRPEVSPRELEVLRLVRDGMTNAQVARRLGIAEATVAKHLEHVYSRTGARSRTHAVALCAEILGAG
jgi:DNA-binding CsgD family transcriptional regulator